MVLRLKFVFATAYIYDATTYLCGAVTCFYCAKTYLIGATICLCAAILACFGLPFILYKRVILSHEKEVILAWCCNECLIISLEFLALLRTQIYTISFTDMYTTICYLYNTHTYLCKQYADVNIGICQSRLSNKNVII